MSDSEKDPMNDLLSSFALGPAWARDASSDSKARSPKAGSPPRERSPRRDDRGSDDRKGGSRDRDNDRRAPRGRSRNFDDRRDGPPRNVEAPPADGVTVTLIPDAEAVHLIGKEVHQVARAYPLFDVAKILLAERKRCRAHFKCEASRPPLLRSKLDDAVFLTRKEALNHLWQSDLRNQFIEEQIIEVDPPKGNFQSIARCGISGEWLGPPNYHSYQVNLHRLHRERFANMPFATYASKVRTERGEEAVNAWLETMKKSTRWRIKTDAPESSIADSAEPVETTEPAEPIETLEAAEPAEENWIDKREDAERALATHCFDQAFEETHSTEVLASIPLENISPSLMTSLKIVGNHARNHPAMLIPAVCRAVEAEHLPVFKRKGKLLTGPARPHPLPADAVLAERPGIMVKWIRENSPAKLEGLWKAILPEGSTAPPAEFAADLFWLLHQGHILLFTDDTLVVQEVRETHTPDTEPGAKTAKRKRKRSKKSKAGTTSPAGTPAAETPAPADTPEAQAPAPETTQEPSSSETPAPNTSDSHNTATDAPPAEPEKPAAPITNAPVTEEAAKAPAPTPESSPEAPAPEPMTEPAQEPATAESPAVEASTPTPDSGQNDEISKNPVTGVDGTPGL